MFEHPLSGCQWQAPNPEAQTRLGRPGPGDKALGLRLHRPRAPAAAVKERGGRGGGGVGGGNLGCGHLGDFGFSRLSRVRLGS